MLNIFWLLTKQLITFMGNFFQNQNMPMQKITYDNILNEVSDEDETLLLIVQNITVNL